MINLKTTIIDNLKIDKFLKSVKDTYEGKIGILGSQASAQHGTTGLTNAAIGLNHELGSISRNIPMRSFLRMPINKEKKNIFDLCRKTLLSQLNSGIVDLKKTMTMMCVKALEASSNAFLTQGFGMWKPLKESTIKRKGNDVPLVDTRQLIRSRSFKVDKIK